MKDTISHIYKDATGKWKIQTNAEHSNNVAELARSFADEFGMGTCGYVLGLLHDKGKESDAFQSYIRKESGYDPEAKYSEEHKHAFVGGVIAKGIYGETALNFFCNQIVSHHTGLHNTCELDNILSKDIPQGVNNQVEEIRLTPSELKPKSQDFHHLFRMLFSCLTDADYLDTEAFMNKQASKIRKNDTKLSDLLTKLEQYITTLQKNATTSDVNTIRQQVSEQCRKVSCTERGFFSLTVPTGGGKTLSSLLWAMKHAVHNNMKRIIIAIPYTSIIAQTASILKSIFGEENVLEHHSNFDPSTIKNPILRHKAKLATENWDYPIVVTTNVQLFQSMFANKPSECRKLHNIVNTVIILDEVQTLPTDFLQPIVDTLKSYNNLFGVSVLFTTASQPILSGIIEGCNPRAAFSGIENIREIIPQDFALQDKLRRVKIEMDNFSSNYDEIASRLLQHDKVLCIVNTRKDAKEIFERLSKEEEKDGDTLHLSKMMCPKHIRETINNIRTALKQGKEVIRVVSTQLIEAGVDIDFPIVYRQEAGLDSILQAAGRCNREGRLDMATTYVFSLAKEHSLYGEIVDANNARLNMTNVDDWFSPEAMTEYFRQLYCRKETFDKKKIQDLLYRPKDIYFADAAHEFKLIEDVGKSVVVNMDDSLELVESLKQNGINYALMVKLSQYIVNIRENEYKQLDSYKAIEEVIEGIYVVKDKEQYSDKIGLRLDNHWNDGLIIT